MQTNSLFYSDADKRRARLELGKIRADIYDVKSYSECLCNEITTLQEYKVADIILLYFPTSSEPDLTALLNTAHNDGKEVSFPISQTDELKLDFRTVRSFDELDKGAYGIYEPSKSCKKTLFSQRTLCIVPALAIDTDGYRLGYGKGYYDRFLADFEGKSAVALHSSLVCDRLPRNDTDVPIKIIITETGAIRLK